ncbi:MULTISPECIES: nucleotide pyrophosphohydrolase [Oceanotoga]|jgi:NTP pyrophosphatase (non-canonical NTP hydrolase)|nr:hypothetical protein [Oceanotoga sp.]
MKFVEERDWNQYHNPKDLIISLNLEAAELLEIFQWKDEKEVKQVLSDEREHIEEEVADVAIYLMEFCNYLGIDLYEAIDKKIVKNGIKYPVNKCKGSNKKYNEL